jgi:hypothetical protein
MGAEMITHTTIYADQSPKIKITTQRSGINEGFVFFKLDDYPNQSTTITFNRQHIPAIEELLTKLRGLPE